MEGLEEVKGRFWATIRTPVPLHMVPGWLVARVSGSWDAEECVILFVYGFGQLSKNFLIFQSSHLILKFSTGTNLICILL